MSSKKIIITLALIISVFINVRCQDLAVTSIPSVSSGCNLSSCNPITIILINNGPVAISASPVFVSYAVNGTWIAPETFSLSLPVGATYIYTFLTCADFSNQGTYIVEGAVSMVGDFVSLNDTLAVVIVEDTTVVGGTLGLSDTVCASGNAGVLTLSGNTGYINYWQYSTTAPGAPPWTTLADTTNTLAYSGLTTTTYFQVVIEGGFCPDGLSPIAVIQVDDTTDAGITISNATVCATGNSGTINLAGNNGTILDWTFSNDGGVTWTSLGNTTNSNNYFNLTTTTFFHVIVKNGVCPKDSSSITTITVTPPPIPGTVAADAVVCFGTNSDSLFLLGYSGTIASWISTTTGGPPYNNILNTTFIQPYSGLTTTTIYCAILQNGVCPADTSVCATVTVLPPTVADAGVDTLISLGDTVCFSGTGGIFYNWLPPVMLVGSNTSTPCIIGADSVGTFIYTLTVTDGAGCTDTDVMAVTVLDTTTIIPPVIPEFIVSNFITPNGDGDNDVWNIFDKYSLESITFFYPANEVTVMSNHGQILYNKVAYTNDWDGGGLPDGSYYYIVKIDVIDKTYTGILTISSSK